MKTFGPYSILGQLGAGGMGVVYEAEQDALGRRVALKLLPESDRDGGDRARFVREMKLAATVVHPNLVKVFDGGVLDGAPFIAMELVDGESLQAFLERSHALTWPQAASIALGIANGLAALHEHGIIHRDLKPSNILLRPSGVPTIIDFGLARLDDSPSMTEAGSTVGTPVFLSPEVLAGQRCSTASDLWALGCILFQMLTGQLPFDHTSISRLAFAIQAEPVPIPRVLDPRIPDALSDLVLRLLERDLARRTVSAAVLAQQLAQIPESSQSATTPSIVEQMHGILHPTVARTRRARRTVESSETRQLRKPFAFLPRGVAAGLLIAGALSIMWKAHGWLGGPRSESTVIVSADALRETHRQRGLFLERSGHLAEAEREYRLFLAAKPNDKEVVFKLVRLLDNQGSFLLADRELRRALAAAGGDPDPELLVRRLILSDRLRARGLEAEAAAEIQFVLRVDPNNPAAHYRWGRRLLEQGSFVRAEEELRRAVATERPRVPWLNCLAKTLMRRSQFRESEQFFRRSLQVEPNNGDALEGLLELQVIYNHKDQ